MSKINNSVTLIGNLGQDPKVHTFNDGNKKTSFTVATNDKYIRKSDGQKVEETEWHNCVASGALAGVIEQYLRKGNKVAIEGKLRHRQYEKDGMTKYITEIMVRDMEMLDTKNTSDNTTNDQPDPRNANVPF